MTIQLSRRTVAVALAALLALTAIATTSLVLTLTGRAEANDKFNDIATGTFFHDSTAWLADNGIADGFGDGTFRTGDNITRGQASYWFANYNEAIFLEDDSATLTTPIVGGGEFRRTATCPAGNRAVAGGGRAANQRMAIHNSFPNGSSWSVDWAADDGTDQVPGLVEVWALCVPGIPL